MSKQENKGLMPTLRFPEFQGQGAWDVKSLGDVTFKADKKNKEGKRYPIYSINNQVGFIPQAEQFDGVDSHKRGYDITLYKVIEKNTFAYNPARINVGSIGFSGALHNIIISSLYVCFKTTEEANENFLQHFFDSFAFNESVKNNAEGGIRSYLFYENFAKIKIALPKIAEQQKIADCLSSIDDLITAQTQKLAALNTHKKGLMQQLFPVEGETVPKLRFPEFRDKGEWGEQNFYSLLVEVLDFRGRTPKKLGMDWGGGNIVSLSANNVKNGYIDFGAECNLGSEALYEKWMGKVNLEQGDIVFTMEAPLGNALLVPDSSKYILSQRVVAFKTQPSINNSFLIQLIWSSKFQRELTKLSTGSTAKGINQKSLQKINVRIPQDEIEQQKIADCLSSIDDLITAQTQKLEAIKAHKKGLMQQLFPTIDEVAA